MMGAVKRLGLLLLVAALGLARVVGSEEEAIAAFDTATQLYSEEKFVESSDQFSDLAASWGSPEIFCNAGSAAYRADEQGRAVLWYKRALVLDSTFAEAKQNLRFLRRKQGFLRFEPKPLDDFAGALRRPTWGRLALLAGGIAGVALLALLFLKTQRSRALLIWAVVLGTVGLGVALTGYLAKVRTDQLLSMHIVVGSKVSALTAPNDTAGMVVALPPGSEVLHLEARGPWIYVAIPSGSRGWVRTASLEKLWPYSPKLVE